MARVQPFQPARPAERAPDAKAGGRVAAIDVGASKFAVLTGGLSPQGALEIQGAGVACARKGALGAPLDFEAAVRALRVALDEAEADGGAPIESAAVSYSGPGVRSERATGVAQVRGAVEPKDCKLAIEAARDAVGTGPRAALHAIPLSYRVDDGEPVADPRGLSGSRLSVEVTVVTAPAAALEGLRDLAREAGVRLVRVAAGPYVSALSALTAADRAGSALAIDLGAGATGAAGFAGGGLAFCETLPIGGARLTEDLAAHLGASFAAAERAKLAYAGLAAIPAGKVEIPRLGPDGRLEPALVDPRDLQRFLQPGLQQVFERVAARLLAGRFDVSACRRIVLMGGGAQLAGAQSAAERVFARPVEIAAPESALEDFDASAPAFAAAAGLLRWRLDRPPEAAPAPPAAQTAFQNVYRRPGEDVPDEGPVGRALAWLRENL